jgi:hypothetical protein
MEKELNEWDDVPRRKMASSQHEEDEGHRVFQATTDGGAIDVTVGSDEAEEIKGVIRLTQPVSS